MAEVCGEKWTRELYGKETLLRRARNKEWLESDELTERQKEKIAGCVAL